MIIAYGQIEKGGLVMDNSRLFWESLSLLEGTRIVVEVKRYSSKRSTAANAFYWATIVKGMSEVTGYTPEECHEILKSKCNSRIDYIENAITGNYEEIQHSQSTTKLTPTQFGEYIDKCVAFLADLGIFVEPSPGVPEAGAEEGQGAEAEARFGAESQDEGGRAGVQHGYEDD